MSAALARIGDHAAVYALYASLPADDVHPFASYRRDAGLAFGCLRHAGDGGYTRLRAMGLLIVARTLGPGAGAAALARARAIAARLEDTELLARVVRAGG